MNDIRKHPSARVIYKISSRSRRHQTHTDSGEACRMRFRYVVLVILLDSEDTDFLVVKSMRLKISWMEGFDITLVERNIHPYSKMTDTCLAHVFFRPELRRKFRYSSFRPLEEW